jgi:hypothetical protein
MVVQVPPPEKFYEYAIRYNGTGLRRVTNSPACAELAALPKGSVEVEVANYTSSLVQVYVQGAPGIQSVLAWRAVR